MVKTHYTLPYDITQATSIFEYSKGLLGKTLRDFVWDGYKPKKGKGSLGQMVENIYFLLETKVFQLFQSFHCSIRFLLGFSKFLSLIGFTGIRFT